MSLRRSWQHWHHRGNIGDIATAAGQLTEKDKFDEFFWTKVQQAFIQPPPVHDKSQSEDDEHLQGSIGIDPLKMEQHDWSKLRKIHKDVKKDEKGQTATLKSLAHMNWNSVSSAEDSRTLAVSKSCLFS